MKPHIEEAWRLLRLADRDLMAFDILRKEPKAHPSIVCFHAQQVVEKSFKAVLFSRQIEFRRTHDLTELAQLLRDHGMKAPVGDDPLRRLNPFAVILRYDDVDVELAMPEDVAGWVTNVRHWAEEQVNAAMKDEENRC